MAGSAGVGDRECCLHGSRRRRFESHRLPRRGEDAILLLLANTGVWTLDTGQQKTRPRPSFVGALKDPSRIILRQFSDNIVCRKSNISGPSNRSSHKVSSWSVLDLPLYLMLR